jgi:hypothetical protein
VVVVVRGPSRDGLLNPVLTSWHSFYVRLVLIVSFHLQLGLRALLVFRLHLEDDCVVEHCVVYSGRNLRRFRSACSKSGLHRPDDGGGKHFWNGITFYQTTRRNTPGNTHILTRRHTNLKSHVRYVPRLWWLLTAITIPLTPNFPQGHGLANRGILHERNPAVVERLCTKPHDDNCFVAL